MVAGGSLALGACGDDETPGTGDGSSTAAMDDSTSTPMTMTTMGSVDTTQGTGTVGPTTDPTTSVDTTMGETSADTDPPPVALQAYRFTSMYVRDPHFFVLGLGVLCIDVTDDVPTGDPSINEQFNTAIESDDPMDPDGNLDLNLMLLFRPLDQSDGASADMEFANGVCTVPPIECDLQAGTNPFPTGYLVMQAGTCLEPDPAHLSSEGYNPPPGTTTGPCFVSEATDVEIVTGDFTLPLADAIISAQLSGDPADDLVEGTLRGFLSTADAENIQLPPDIQMQTGASTISELLPGGNGNCAGHDDTDGDGWWFYVDFTATRALWVGA